MGAGSGTAVKKAMISHSQAYVICATPRSGSTLLCDLLADTAVAGQPDSFFRVASLEWWAGYLEVSMDAWGDQLAFDESYLAAVLAEGAGAGATFGMRLMWRDFDHLAQNLARLRPGLRRERDRFDATFGPTRYIHLSRADKAAQAISLIRAEQTGLWHVNEDGSERERQHPAQAAVYDAAAIARQLAEFEAHDLAWNQWFSRQNIDPLRICYEDLAREPAAVMVDILAFLGLDPAPAQAVRPSTRKLADGDSRDWLQRFRAEFGDSDPHA